MGDYDPLGLRTRLLNIVVPAMEHPTHGTVGRMGDKLVEAVGKEAVDAEAVREAITHAAYCLDPTLGEDADPDLAYKWLRTTYPVGHPNYVDPASLPEPSVRRRRKASPEDVIAERLRPYLTGAAWADDPRAILREVLAGFLVVPSELDNDSIERAAAAVQEEFDERGLGSADLITAVVLDAFLAPYRPTED